MDTTFEWDVQKARGNLAKHGVGFDEAQTVFGDPLVITVPDDDHSHAEDRWIDLGYSASGRLLVTWYAQRGDRIRLIGCLPATSTERRWYHDERIH
jgi:uncharacterized DUF497 family protein